MEVRDIIETIIKEVVDTPDSVNVKDIEGDRTSVIEVQAAKGDMGKIIGKSGSMARALRTICSSIGGKQNHKYLLQIVDE